MPLVALGSHVASGCGQVLSEAAVALPGFPRPCKLSLNRGPLLKGQFYMFCLWLPFKLALKSETQELQSGVDGLIDCVWSLVAPENAAGRRFGCHLATQMRRVADPVFCLPAPVGMVNQRAFPHGQ